jgi:hypothetical protein
MNAATTGAIVAAAAAKANAIKASGVIVEVEPETFQALLAESSQGMVVTATGGVFSTHYRYLTSISGLAFFTRSKAELKLPEGVRLIAAKSIWVPEV